jgi:hypothetical protein
MSAMRARVDAIDMPNTPRSHASRAAIGRIATVAVAVVREQQALRRAVKRIPKPVPWTWARPRVGVRVYPGARLIGGAS